MSNDGDELEPIEVQEPLEEVLHHTTEQTLRLAHIDESVGELKASMNELGETVATGFVELRSSVMQAASRVGEAGAPLPTSGGLDDSYKQHLNERLEDVERKIGVVKGRLGLLGAFMVLQLGIGGALLASALGYLEKKQLEAPPPPPPVAAPVVTPPPEVAPEPLVPPVPAVKESPRKKHRR